MLSDSFSNLQLPPFCWYIGYNKNCKKVLKQDIETLFDISLGNKLNFLKIEETSIEDYRGKNFIIFFKLFKKNNEPPRCATAACSALYTHTGLLHPCEFICDSVWKKWKEKPRVLWLRLVSRKSVKCRLRQRGEDKLVRGMNHSWFLCCGNLPPPLSQLHRKPLPQGKSWVWRNVLPQVDYSPRWHQG